MKQQNGRAEFVTGKKDRGMKNRKKRIQREEVRKILAAIREELAAHRLEYEELPERKPPVAIGEVIRRARSRASS